MKFKEGKGLARFHRESTSAGTRRSRSPIKASGRCPKCKHFHYNLRDGELCPQCSGERP